MPVNAAAVIPARHAPLEVRDAPYTAPGADEIVIRARAIAVNPLDWIIQVAGHLAFRWLRYPAVLGSDVAGEVAEIGSGVTRFAVGDRVLAHAVGTDKDANRAAEGAFQRYVVVRERMAAPIPDSLAYVDAAVLPLAVSTAACGLFQTDLLSLRHPTARPEATGETVLVWGGSTSVGANAIQLAVAAGYEVMSTASPHNAEFVRSLGATEVYDYNRPDVIPVITAALRDRRLAGAIAFGTTSGDACVRIAAVSDGHRFVALGSPAVSFDTLADSPHRARETLRIMPRLVGATVATLARARRHGVSVKNIFGTTLKGNEVSLAIYGDYLPAALAEGRYRAAPGPRVVGDGLSHLQHAMDLQRAGVSAEKLVVTVSEESD